jgi:TatD DNase family protein
MKVIDSHAHLDLLEENGMLPDWSKLDGAITISTKRQHAETLKKYTTHDKVWRTVGIHPCQITNEALEWQWLDDACKGDKVVAVGEIGLDKHYTDQYLEQQKKAFSAQLDIAKKNNLPVVIHTRDAELETIEILKIHRPRGVIHCFVGSAEFAQQCLDLGMYIAFGGAVTFKSNHDLRRIAQSIPLDRILVETDAPYLTPEPHRKHKNRSEYARIVAEFLADLLKCDANVFAENTCRLFNIKV